MSIEICHVCDGYGYENVIDPDSLINEKIACRRCESSGRLVRTTTYETLSSHRIGDVKPPDASYAEVEAKAWKIYDDEPRGGIEDAPLWTTLADETKQPYRDLAIKALKGND